MVREGNEEGGSERGKRVSKRGVDLDICPGAQVPSCATTA